MMLISNDIVISIDDYLISLLNEHFYGIGQQFTLEQKRQEIYWFMQRFEKDGIKLIDVKTTKKTYIEILFNANGKRHCIRY